MTVATVNPQLHIRYDGRSIDLNLADLDLGTLSTDEQIRAVTARHLGIPDQKLRAFTIDRNTETGDLTLRPEAVFGGE